MAFIDDVKRLDLTEQPFGIREFTQMIAKYKNHIQILYDVIDTQKAIIISYEDKKDIVRASDAAVNKVTQAGIDMSVQCDIVQYPPDGRDPDVGMIHHRAPIMSQISNDRDIGVNYTMVPNESIVFRSEPSSTPKMKTIISEDIWAGSWESGQKNIMIVPQKCISFQEFNGVSLNEVFLIYCFGKTYCKQLVLIEAFESLEKAIKTLPDLHGLCPTIDPSSIEKFHRDLAWEADYYGPVTLLWLKQPVSIADGLILNDVYIYDNYVTQLTEICRHHLLKEIEVIKTESKGPAHKPIITVTLTAGGFTSTAASNTKKDAKLQACGKIVDKMQSLLDQGCSFDDFRSGIYMNQVI